MKLTLNTSVAKQKFILKGFSSEMDTFLERVCASFRNRINEVFHPALFMNAMDLLPRALLPFDLLAMLP